MQFWYLLFACVAGRQNETRTMNSVHQQAQLTPAIFSGRLSLGQTKAAQPGAEPVFRSFERVSPTWESPWVQRV